MSRGIALLLVITVLAGLGGCSGMSTTQQRALSSGAMGAGTGLLIGGPVGAAGGYAYDQHQKSEGKP